MTMDTSRNDMTQAVLEGVAFALRDSLEVARSLGLHIERIEDLRRRSKEPALEKNYGQRPEPEGGYD